MLYTAAALLSLLSAAEAYSLGGAALASRETTVLAARGVAVASRRAALVSMQMPGAQDEVKIVADETYGIMMKTLLQTENPLDQEVSANYALIDYAFLQRLDSALQDSDEKIANRATVIKEAVNTEMANRMQTAAETLKDIFTSPTPVIMDGKIAGLARAGRIDDALFQLLQANLEQAQAAGEAGANAVAMLTKLQNRVRDEMDAKLDPPIALIRRLMRMDSAEARQRLLREKMAPKATSKIVIAGVEGDEADDDPTPEVPPRVMAEAITDMKFKFGNVDENYDTGFVKKLELIGDEAEAVALELAGGKELSAKEAQDLAWNKQSVSVWDLEQVENEARQDGNFAVWEQEAQDQMARQESDARANAIQKDMST